VEIPKAIGAAHTVARPSRRCSTASSSRRLLQVLQAEMGPDVLRAQLRLSAESARRIRRCWLGAQELIASGHDIVVDIDLEKILRTGSTTNILMGLVAKTGGRQACS